MVGLHLASLLFVIVSIVLVMATASYHRIAEPGQASRPKIRRTSRLIWSAMFFLMLGLGLDVFVVTYMATGSKALSTVFGCGVVVLCASAWFVFPLWVRAHLRPK